MNMAKRKGYQFERETAALGREYGRRVERSGAIGTSSGVPGMIGDVQWRFPWMGREIISIECKHGYDDDSKHKSFRIYREWFDKHQSQTKAGDVLPAYAMKFKGTQENGVASFVLIPFATMKEIIRQMENVYQELKEFKDERAREER